MLVSRDEQSCLVVSYKEIKQCIESAFGFVISFLLSTLCSYVVMIVILQVRAHEGREFYHCLVINR